MLESNIQAMNDKIISTLTSLPHYPGAAPSTTQLVALWTDYKVKAFVLDRTFYERSQKLSAAVAYLAAEKVSQETPLWWNFL